MTSSEASSSYETVVPSTSRSAGELAHRFGYLSVKSLAADLQPGARVLDAGAGQSNLGATVALLRPDIEWVNFDLRYNDPELLARASKDAPSNLRFVAGDIAELPAHFGPDHFDRIFTYWLLPHLSLNDRRPAIVAVNNLLEVAKEDALIKAGPIGNRGKLRMFGSTKSVRKPADPAAYPAAIAQLSEATRLGVRTRKFQTSINRTGYEMYGGTSAWTTGRGVGMRVYSKKQDAYIPFFTPTGLSLVGRHIAKSYWHFLRSPRNR